MKHLVRLQHFQLLNLLHICTEAYTAESKRALPTKHTIPLEPKSEIRDTGIGLSWWHLILECARALCVDLERRKNNRSTSALKLATRLTR